MGGFQFSSGGKSFSFGSAPAGSAKHHRHGIGGLVANLGSDVKDAVVGLPTGVVQLVKHPVKSGKLIARTTWQDWKPLIEGHPVQFAKQTYDHPLAPLLDVATVFSAGAGISAKLGEAAVEAGSTSRLAKGAADLGKSGSRQVTDARAIADGRVPRPSLPKTHSASAGKNLRRELANRALLHLEPHLPAWFKQSEREGRLYDRLHGSDIAHRGAATNLQINAIMQAGKAITDPSLQHIIQPELLAHNYWNLRRYAHKHAAGTPLPKGYRYVTELHDPATQFGAKPGVDLESRMRTFGNDYVTSDPKKAARVGKHNLIVPKANVDALAQEGERSTKFLRTMAHKPVTLWKRVNVGYAPRVITNNAVGNWAMHAMRTGGDGGGKGFVDAIKYAHGNRAAMRAFHEMHAQIVKEAEHNAFHAPELTRPTAKSGFYFNQHGDQFPHHFAHDANMQTHNIHDEHGNTIGSMVYDARPSKRSVYVESVFIRPEFRNVSNFQKLLAPIKGEKRPIQAAFQNERLQRVFEKATGRGLVSGKAMVNDTGHVIAKGEVPDAALPDLVKPVERVERMDPSEAGKLAGAKFTSLTHPSLVADPNIAAIEHAFGKRAADAVKRPPDWLRQNFSDELGNVFGNVLDDGKTTRSKAGKALKQGLYPIVHRVADEPVRVAALYQFMRRSPEVKAYLKTHPGAKLDDAIQDVLKRNPGKLRERAVAHTRSIAGDYTAMSPAEKLIQNIVPFYLWDKHIAKHFSEMVGEKPGRVVAMQQVSRMGKDETEKLLGTVPGFLEGALPLSLFGMHKHGDRTPVLGTQGINPYSTIGELADTATALTVRHDSRSGSEAASQLSPILTGLIEQISGHKIGSNAPAESHGGIVPSVLADTALGTSYGTLAQRLVNGTPKPKVDSHGKSKDFLYEKNAHETVAGLLGLPIKNVSLSRAAEMAARDIKKKKRKSTTFAFGR